MINQGPSIAIIVERLRRAEVFNEIPEEDLQAIAQFCTEETHHEGVVVMQEGSPADHLVVVERGRLSLEKKVQLGRQSTPRNATVGYVGKGRIAGFSTLTFPHIYSTSAVCIEPTRLLSIEGSALRSYLDTHSAVGVKVLNALAIIIGERYRSAINTLTYFLSIVSHELRSPLAAIENYLQTMDAGYAGEVNPKQKRMIQRSLIRVIDLRNLIGDVVDLARLRPEQIQADFEWFDPEEVGTESFEDARLAAADKDIQIIIEPPPKFEPIVGARRRMRQVFTNLLNNAIKFSPPGSKVKYRAWYEPEELIFQVEDEGPGIPPEDIPYLFSDFYRASNVGDTPGAGLGLSIAKKIMDAHNGQLLVENIDPNTGKTGTLSTVIIPRNLMTLEMRRREWEAEEQK